MLCPEDRVVAAVSGGADSMLLLHYLLSRRERWQLKITVAHVEHGIRGESSRADAAFVRDFCARQHLSYFEKANPYAVTNYINERLTYDPKLLNGKKEAKGIYTIRIDSYGEIIKVETLRSCGIPEWDKQVLQIIKGMPRWTPTINYYGKGEYHNSVWTVPVLFKNDNR